MDIIAEIASALATQEQTVLATIISSSGSTPLPPGAMMLFKQQGSSVAGTIGGGLLEGNVSSDAKKIFGGSNRFVVRQFELSDGNSEEKMICGGSVDVLIEKLGREDLPVFSKLHDLHKEGTDCILLRVIDASQSGVKRVVLHGTSDDIVQGPPLDNFLNELKLPAEKFLQALQRAQRGEAVERAQGVVGELIIEPIVGIQPLVIFGGGHIGRSLSRIAAAAGFTVTVVDDRKTYADAGRFPDATRILAENLVGAFEHIEIKPAASIVIVTRAHEFDREVLRRAVSTPARYIGMIGSGKKVAATYARLQEEGIPLSSLKRVHAPIGLNISAVTAEEIAVSIVADLIRVRRGMSIASASMSERMGSWFDRAAKGPAEE
jgi:xanthine dehydrogenase accessory factor